MPEANLPHREFIHKVISSPIQYWMGHAANYSLVVYLVSRARAYPGDVRGLAWGAIPAVAYLAWTLAEYALHRGPYHNVNSASSTGHILHHEDPDGLLGTPFYLNMALMLSLQYGLGRLTHAPGATGLFLGSFWFGHVVYSWVHHGVHHWSLKARWFVELKRHHKIHHVKPDCNFGVTTRLWDRVFRTGLVKPSAAAELKESA